MIVVLVEVVLSFELLSKGLFWESLFLACLFLLSRWAIIFSALSTSFETIQLMMSCIKGASILFSFSIILLMSLLYLDVLELLIGAAMAVDARYLQRWRL